MTARAVQKNEINITPFVDVMLVLLIIFMVAAPLSTTNLNLTMPPPGPAVAPTVEPVFVSLHENGVIYVGSERLGETQGNWLSLPAMLTSKSSGDLSRPVFVRADQTVGYGDVVRLIDELRAAGYAKVG